MRVHTREVSSPTAVLPPPSLVQCPPSVDPPPTLGGGGGISPFGTRTGVCSFSPQFVSISCLCPTSPPRRVTAGEGATWGGGGTAAVHTIQMSTCIAPCPATTPLSCRAVPPGVHAPHDGKGVRTAGVQFNSVFLSGNNSESGPYVCSLGGGMPVFAGGLASRFLRF